MKTTFLHIKTYVWRGFWAVIPLALSIYAIRLLYLLIDRRVSDSVSRLTGFSLPGLGILIVILVLYLLGVITSNVLGRKIFQLLDLASDKIPVIKTTYRVGKELAQTFTMNERRVFERAVLVEYLSPGMWTVGFVTGTVKDTVAGRELLKVYVPTPPNPTSGTLIFVGEAEILNPGWSIEEALKAVISAGLVTPDEIQLATG